MKLDGQRLRAKLDKSATDRHNSSRQRSQDAAHEQRQRQNQNAARAEEQQHNATRVHTQLQDMAHRRATDSSINGVERAIQKAALQNATQETLQNLSDNRQRDGEQRAADRSQARARLGQDTANMLGDAANARSELRRDLNEFADAIHGRSARVSFEELELSKPAKRVVKRTVTPVAAKPAAAPKPAAPDRSFSPTIGAMHNPEPMTAILRRREQVLIKMIAANPGIRIEQLESSLVLDKTEVQRILKQLVAQNRLLNYNGSYHIATLQPA